MSPKKNCSGQPLLVAMFMSLALAVGGGRGALGGSSNLPPGHRVPFTFLG